MFTNIYRYIYQWNTLTSVIFFKMTWVGEGMEEETKSSELKILTLDDGSSLEYTIYFGIRLKLFLIKKKSITLFAKLLIEYHTLLLLYGMAWFGVAFLEMLRVFCLLVLKFMIYHYFQTVVSMLILVCNMRNGWLCLQF